MVNSGSKVFSIYCILQALTSALETAVSHSLELVLFISEWFGREEGTIIKPVVLKFSEVTLESSLEHVQPEK